MNWSNKDQQKQTALSSYVNISVASYNNGGRQATWRLLNLKIKIDLSSKEKLQCCIYFC